MKVKCPVCGSTIVDVMFSTSEMWCCECKKIYPFVLKKGKKSILIKNKVGN